MSIYIRYDDGYAQSLSRFRSTGMLINTTTEGLPHFSVVIIANDVENKELSKTLREAEPPQHTEWKAKNITDNRTLYNKAARYIRLISKEIQHTLDEFEKAEITDRMDAGVGNYLPDTSDNSITSEGTDGLKTDIKINEISSFDGRVFYNNQYESAENSNGSPSQTKGVKNGKKKKRKKKTNIKIPVVKHDDGKDKGATSGKGKIKVSTLNIKEHRTFYVAANKYHLYVESPSVYENVYIKYYAGREDNGQDALSIKNIKIEGLPRIDVNGEKIGPITLNEGKNTMYIEFESNEIMAVIPVFTVEVQNEK